MKATVEDIVDLNRARDERQRRVRRRGDVWRARAGVLLLVFALGVIGLGAVARDADAYSGDMHGGIDTCGVCHENDHTYIPPTNEKCLTCHGDYEVANGSLTCWTCHRPGQDMSTERADAACTTACHLVDGTTITHSAHVDRPLTCTTCHPLSASVTEASGSSHHTFSPPVPTVTSFLSGSGVARSTVTVTGSGFVRVIAVTFNGVGAARFWVDSETKLTATVPVGATTGAITVTAVGGSATSATSATSFTVLPSQAAPNVTLFFPLSGLAGSPVTVTGAGFTGATAVTFNGSPATLGVVSDTKITTTVPAGATSGPIAVTGSGGTGTSATSFTVLTVVTSEVTLRLSRASVTLGRSVRSTGLLEPLSLAGDAVKLTVQRKKSGRWVTVKTGSMATTSTGAYAWTYKPGRRGAFRVRTSIAATATNTAARTKWVAFGVK